MNHNRTNPLLIGDLFISCVKLPEMKFAGYWCGAGLLEQGDGEVCETGTGAVEGGRRRWVWLAAVWEWLFQQAAGKKICALLGVIGGVGEQDPQGSIVLWLWVLPAAFYTSFANVGGCAQLLLSERLMGEQRSKQDMNAALAPSAFGAHRGKGLLEGTEKHKQIEVLAWLCLPQ